MRHSRATLLLLAAAALASMAPTCAPRNSATLYFDPPTLTVAAGSYFEVDVVASISGSLQAFELKALGTPSSLAPDAALPHADFDDDGKLLVAPQVDPVAGTLSRIADLRHGATAVSGARRLVRLRFYAHTPGSAELRLPKRDLASPTGTPLTTGVVAATVTVTP